MMESPALDDRSFDQLVEEARAIIQRRSPSWTDLSVHDPGIVLVEVFAHLTELMLYRLNRLPDRAYVAFLRLLGVRLQPPTAAEVELLFRRAATQEALIIPRGTRVTVARALDGEPPVFVTAAPLSLLPGVAEASVLAHHCEIVDGELVGHGSGQPALIVQASRPPIIAPLGDETGVLVGVERSIEDSGPAIRFADRTFAVWREVESFEHLDEDTRVYQVDRVSGTVLFAPEGSAGAVPPAGAQIRIWYRRGGGRSGNVAPGQLTVLKDALPGIQVDNPRGASGGTEAETLEAAKRRGPESFRAIERAVTAQDFELLARRAGGIARAKALTQAALWSHAVPGTVEVLLVPEVPEAATPGGQLTAASYAQHCTEILRRRVERLLEERRPLGTRCVVSWAKVKPVSVKLEVVVRPEEDPSAVRARLLQRLHHTVTPLPVPPKRSGWPFGRSLREYHIYDLVSNEPGVDYIEKVTFEAADVPDGETGAVAADHFQPSTWYIGAGDRVFRSVDDGIGWDPVATFDAWTVRRIQVHPNRPGWVAVVNLRAGDTAATSHSRIHVSADCGETWRQLAQTTFAVRDIAWTDQGGTPSLLLATESGFYHLGVAQGSVPLQASVDPARPDLGIAATAAIRGARGDWYVALAATDGGGIFLSAMAGESGSFKRIGLEGRSVRALTLVNEGPRTFLWAGEIAVGNDPGEGCHRRELIGDQDIPGGWQSFKRDWQGGGCHALCVTDGRVIAATARAGVVSLDLKQPEAGWELPAVTSGLPVRSRERFEPVTSLAAKRDGGLLLAGGLQGPFRSADAGRSWQSCAERVFPERVTLPPSWLFCSGEHEVAVAKRHATVLD